MQTAQCFTWNIGLDRDNILLLLLFEGLYVSRETFLKGKYRQEGPPSQRAGGLMARAEVTSGFVSTGSTNLGLGRSLLKNQRTPLPFPEWQGVFARFL